MFGVVLAVVFDIINVVLGLSVGRPVFFALQFSMTFCRLLLAWRILDEGNNIFATTQYIYIYIQKYGLAEGYSVVGEIIVLRVDQLT